MGRMERGTVGQDAFDSVNNEKRHFMRVDCEATAEFQLPDRGPIWYPAEVLDISIIGVRIRFARQQDEGELSDEDIQWQDVRFRFTDDEEAAGLVLDGHFLMIYQKDEGLLTSGIEFVNVVPEQQFKLVLLYAKHRQAQTRS
ncbi:MAG: PilZ domain-containing protein [Synergistaceae bacterium]|nr:PilZ domain-containing protein [Synergistaceae bacterium]